MWVALLAICAAIVVGIIVHSSLQKPKHKINQDPAPSEPPKLKP